MLYSELLNPALQNTFSASYANTEHRVELALTPVYRDPVTQHYHLVMLKRSDQQHAVTDQHQSPVYFEAYDTVLNGKREFLSSRYQNRLYQEQYLADLAKLNTEIFICGLAEEPGEDHTIGHYLVGFIVIDGLEPQKIENPCIIDDQNYQTIHLDSHEPTNLIFDITKNYDIIYQYLYASLPNNDISYATFIKAFESPEKPLDTAIHGTHFGHQALMTPKIFVTLQKLIQGYKLQMYLDSYYSI